MPEEAVRSTQQQIQPKPRLGQKLSTIPAYPTAQSKISERQAQAESIASFCALDCAEADEQGSGFVIEDRIDNETGVRLLDQPAMKKLFGPGRSFRRGV